MTTPLTGQWPWVFVFCFVELGPWYDLIAPGEVKALRGEHSGRARDMTVMPTFYEAGGEVSPPNVWSLAKQTRMELSVMPPVVSHPGLDGARPEERTG